MIRSHELFVVVGVWRLWRPWIKSDVMVSLFQLQPEFQGSLGPGVSEYHVGASSAMTSLPPPTCTSPTPGNI